METGQAILATLVGLGILYGLFVLYKKSKSKDTARSGSRSGGSGKSRTKLPK